MERIINGLQQNPILIIIMVIAAIGFILSIGPMMKAKKIGKVTCSKCNNVGKLKQTITNKLVCSTCGSDDWKPDQPAATSS